MAVNDNSLDDKQFAALIYRALTDDALCEDDFRDEFSLSAGTVWRWSSGQNLPQPSVRAKIAGWVNSRDKTRA